MNDKIIKMQEHSHNFLKEFKEFAMRGNVIDLAIGVIIGSAFTSITTSLVKDIIMPPLGLLLSEVDFENLYINLSDREFATLAEAQAAGVPTINYGAFINNIIDFLILALVIFIVVRQINHLRRHEKEQQPSQKECPYCLSKIPLQATRCASCTATL